MAAGWLDAAIGAIHPAARATEKPTQPQKAQLRVMTINRRAAFLMRLLAACHPQPACLQEIVEHPHDEVRDEQRGRPKLFEAPGGCAARRLGADLERGRPALARAMAMGRPVAEPPAVAA